MHTLHIDYAHHAPQPYRQLLQINRQLHQGALDEVLLELVFLRVSQINGCVFCMDLHSRALRQRDVAPRKLDTLPGWRESPDFDARERAALAWAETLNRLGAAAPPADALERARVHFDERELTELSFGVVTIRAFNLLSVGLRKPL